MVEVANNFCIARADRTVDGGETTQYIPYERGLIKRLKGGELVIFGRMDNGKFTWFTKCKPKVVYGIEIRDGKYTVKVKLTWVDTNYLRIVQNNFGKTRESLQGRSE